MTPFVVKEIVFLILLQIFGFVCIPVSIYGIYQLYIHRHKQYICKRNKSITILKLTSFIVFQMASYLAGNAINLIPSSEIMLIYDSVTLITLLSCLLAALLPTNWLTLYLNNWSIAMSNKKWKYIIIGDHGGNWFIKHKKTYGSWKYIGKYIVIFVGIVCIGANICAAYGFTFMFKGELAAYLLVQTGTVTILGLPVILLFVIIKKIPVFKDCYYISSEHARNIKISILLLICTCIVPGQLAIEIFSGVPAYVAGTDSCIWSCIVWIGIGCAYTVSSTLLVIRDNKDNDHEFTRINSVDTGTMKLNQVIMNEESMEKLVNQLIKEIALENILFFIECNQFIQYIHDHFPDIKKAIHSRYVLFLSDDNVYIFPYQYDTV